MGNGEHDDGFVENQECDEVRESTNRYPSYFQIVGDALYQGGGLWPTSDRLDSPIHGGKECEPEPLSPIFIPPRSVIEFLDRLIDEADTGRHLSSA